MKFDEIICLIGLFAGLWMMIIAEIDHDLMDAIAALFTFTAAAFYGTLIYFEKRIKKVVANGEDQSED